MNNLIKYIIESKFNFNIDQMDLRDNEKDFSLSKQKYKSKSMKQEYLENSLFVDLGLPSGTLWARYNLGVDYKSLNNKEEWYGNFYAWAEIEPNKAVYNWQTYKYAISFLTKYCNDDYHGINGFVDNLSQLLSEDDAAFQTNNEWKIPTIEQCQELLDNTYPIEKTSYKDVNELNGIVLISKINGNELFLPYVGYKIEGNVDKISTLIWSSGIDKENSLFGMAIDYNIDLLPVLVTLSRRIGANVRPVKI